MIASLIAAVLAAAQPMPTPTAPTIPTAQIDNTLEITGDPLDAEERRNRLFVEVRVNGKGPFLFLVDSGADRSVVSLDLADRLSLPAGAVARLQSMAGVARVPTAIVDRMTIGKSDIGPIRTPVLSARDIGAQGLIGIDALADQRLLMDFIRKTVTVQDASRPSSGEPGEIVVTARRRKGQLIITQASVRGTKVSAVIDTGSEVTLGNMALRRRLFGQRVLNNARDIKLTSVTGQTLTAQAMVIDNVKVGGITLDNVVIAFADASPFALFGLSNEPAIFLGSDLLNSFRKVGLDFRNRKVRFVLR
ncbi:retroviral-like aspartic protease family protein [Sandarakinorhabdus sp.]|uniref:retroviral-like aspartic protease family protein n=1 Tax=Sandarakinorhabdus sp. TaxID=1916663 RepID=UPI00286DA9E6|nr:retroviral-like aspartic protease family protein [Sandarakinorhabdus sp.]